MNVHKFTVQHYIQYNIYNLATSAPSRKNTTAKLTTAFL